MKRALVIFFLCFLALCFSQTRQEAQQVVRRPIVTSAPSSFSDNFNRSDRALNGDNGWSFAVGSTGFNIVSNVLAIGSVAGDNSQVNSGLSTANGYVQADITPAAPAASVGLIFRYQDASNFLLVDFECNGNVQVSFYKRASGSYSLIDSTVGPACTNGVAYTAKIAFSGSSYEVFVNGASQDTYSDSSITATGLGGLRNGAGDFAARTVDNFTISQ